jgi:hypothetical protein
MEKAARKKTGKTGNGVVDIPHEEVANSTLPAVTPTVITTEDQIKMELAKFNVADSAIAQMKEEYGALVITGPDDKKGYEAVKKAWNLTRTTRTSLEKKGKDLRAAYTVITKAIGQEEDRLIGLISPLEEELHKKWKAIDDEKERAKKEAEEKEQAQLMARVEEIQTLGMTFSDGFYQIGGTISVDVASLRAFNDEQFAKLKGAITAKKAELDKAEADRKETERLANEQRQKDADELKRQHDLLKEQQAELARQQQELEDQKKEAARLKLENRSNQLKALGMTTKGDQFVWDNGFSPVYIAHTYVESTDADTWAAKVVEIKQAIQESTDAKAQHDDQVKAEQAEKERREKFIADALELVGFIYKYDRKVFHFSTPDTGAIEATWNDFTGLDDAARNRPGSTRKKRPNSKSRKSWPWVTRNDISRSTRRSPARPRKWSPVNLRPKSTSNAPRLSWSD